MAAVGQLLDQQPGVYLDERGFELGHLTNRAKFGEALEAGGGG
jgi:hypothetical protein